MKKLADKTYWDSIYKEIDNKGGKSSDTKRSLRDRIKYLTRDYSNHLIWEVLLEKYLPKNKDFKIIEIGCAPGKYLLDFHKRFGYIPYGVEYSSKGVEITQGNIVAAGFPSENIIQADFFDSSFQSRNALKYDVVFSRGFIEHYDNVGPVVRDHYQLLKPRGYLVIMIPNLGGLNKYLAKSLNIDSYKLHNVSIMNRESFRKLFPDDELEHAYCDYAGIFSIGLFNTNSKLKYWLYRFLLLVQRPFDFLFRVLRFKNYFRSSLFSPYLIFIGRKR